MKAEEEWSGELGDEYTKRQTLSRRSRMHMFARVFESMERPTSVLEFGANVGENLVAIANLVDDVETSGVEVNAEAFETLSGVCTAPYRGSMVDFVSDKQWDLTLTRGVLIHIPPPDLARAYHALYRHSKRHIMVAEYYSPTPVEVPYRGKAGLLWKRDFAGEMMDRYRDLRLVDYGFVYHRDPDYPQDDLTWFLMQKA